MPIRCRECEHTGLAHDLHATPEDLAHIRALAAADVARGLQTPPTEPDEFIEIDGIRFTPEQLRTFMNGAGGPFLMQEAIASVRLSQDGDGQTYSV